MDSTPRPPTQSQEVVRPFFTITVLANGQLLETAKFQVRLAPPDQPVLQKPHDGVAAEMLRKIRG